MMQPTTCRKRPYRAPSNRYYLGEARYRLDYLDLHLTGRSSRNGAQA